MAVWPKVAALRSSKNRKQTASKNFSIWPPKFFNLSFFFITYKAIRWFEFALDLNVPPQSNGEFESCGSGESSETQYSLREPYKAFENLGDYKEWLGWQDSNLRMAIPKTAALPLGYTPTMHSKR